MAQSDPGAFEKAVSETRDVGLLGEFWEFLSTTKKWWLLPIVLVIVLFSLLIFLSGTGVAPFIYTVF
jgi:hypothetical protein